MRERTTKREEKLMTTINIKVTDERISDLLVTALDPGYGSSLYWAFIKDRVKPTVFNYRVDQEDSGSDIIYPYADYPMNPGGSLTITANGDDENEEINGKVEWTLDREAIDRGLQVMSDQYPEHFSDAVSESNMDAGTADVFLQCCLFGEVVYG
jgi:hypothetical protein